MPLIQKIYFSTLIFCMATMFYMMSLNSPPNSKDSNPPPPSDPTHLRSNFLDTSPVKNSTPVPQNMIYHFRKPELAQKVLKQLDVFTPVHDSFFGGRTGTKNKYHIPYLGLKNDNKYCDKHRTHFINHPEVVFDQQNFLLSEEPDSFFRGTVVPLVGTDVNPQIGDHMAEPYKRKALFRLKPETNVFFTKTAVNVYKHIGKHFSCLSQISNHIPGHHMLSRKDFVAEGAIEYEKKFVDRPQCFNHDKFFPKTWLLYDKEDCLDFFASLNSVQYQELKKDKGIIYIRKVGVYSHRGEGVQPVDEEEEAALRGNYSDGALCGKVPQNYIIQHFIYNPLLLDGRKFDFRMYMLIASTNPLMAYYHDGFLRVSLMQYDPHSTEKQVLLTNLALNNKIYEDARDGHYYEGMDEEGLKRTQQWSFDQLQGYLLEKGLISDENWLDNYLRPEFKKAMIHLLRLSSDKFLKDSSVYELYGVDFMLDTNLNLWFIEANAGPAFKGYSEPMEKFIIKMLKDHFEIMFGLMRSRMKRVVGYVNGVIDNGGIKVLEDGKVKVLELNENREVFKMITQNYFEKEYEPKADNGFSKIVDGKYTGVRMYQGLISQECL